MLTTILQIVTPVITTVIGYFVGRKKKQAEVDTIELGNYKTMLDHNREMMETLVAQNKKLVTQNNELRTNVNHLSDRVDKLEESNQKLIKSNDQLKASNRKLSKTNETMHKDLERFKDKYPCNECPKK